MGKQDEGENETIQGIEFIDEDLGEMLLVYGGQWNLWICRRDADGEWVPLCLSTPEDRTVIATAAMAWMMDDLEH